MTEDGKGAERVTFSRGYDVCLMAIDGTWRRDCQLNSISDTDATLTVEGSIQGLNLKEFFLLLSSTGLAYRRCELVRVNGTEMDIRFLRGKHAKKRSGAVVKETKRRCTEADRAAAPAASNVASADRMRRFQHGAAFLPDDARRARSPIKRDVESITRDGPITDADESQTRARRAGQVWLASRRDRRRDHCSFGHQRWRGDPRCPGIQQGSAGRCQD